MLIARVHAMISSGVGKEISLNNSLNNSLDFYDLCYDLCMKEKVWVRSGVWNDPRTRKEV